MARIPITVTISTPLPIHVRDMPKFEAVVNAAAAAHGVKPDQIKMRQDGPNLMAYYTHTAR